MVWNLPSLNIPLRPIRCLMTMENETDLRGAPAHMKALGKRTDNQVLTCVEKHPGATVGQIARYLGISNGRADGSVNRLAEEGRVEVKHFLRRGMLIKKVYPPGQPIQPPEVVKISPQLVDLGKWENTVRIYALSRSAIGISPWKDSEWEKIALHEEEVPLDRVNDDVILKIPDRLVEFYELPNSEVDVSGIGDKAMVSIQSTVIPVGMPTTRPKMRVPL